MPQFPLPQRGLPDAFIALCSPSLSASRPRPHGHAPQQREHLGVPGSGTLWWGWGRPFCIPTGDFRGGGAARLLPRRDCIGGSVWLQPWGWGGDVCPSAPRASRCLSPLSSPAKPGSSAPPPSRPDRLRGSSPVPLQPCPFLQPRPSFPFFSAALLASGHRRGQGLPGRLRRGMDGAAVGGRDPPAGGAGREVRAPPQPGWADPKSGFLSPRWGGQKGAVSPRWHPALFPHAQGKHLSAPFANLPGQHQQERQPVQHRPRHALPQHQPARHQSQPGTRPRALGDFGVQSPGSLLPSPARARRRAAILLSPHRGLGDTG